MKKLLSLSLACLLMLGLVGCSTKTNEPSDTAAADNGGEKTVLKVAGLEGGYGRTGWEAVVAAFEEKEGVDVELTLEKTIADTLRSEVRAGQVPDVIYLSVGSEGGFTDTMIAEKMLMEITDVLGMNIYGEEVTVGDKLIGGIEEGLNTMPYGDGKLYLMPINYGPCGLFYNAGLFEEKGWTVPTTWDEMWELGDKAKAEGIALFTYPTTGYFDAFFSALLNETAGPDVFARLMSYDVEAWKLPEVREAFDIVGKLAGYTESTTVANANGDNFTKNQQLILDNKALFIPNGTWLPGEMKEAPRAEGFKWGFTALPAVKEGGDSYSTTFTEQVYIPANAAQPELAKKFLTFLYSDEAVKLFYENGGAVMPVSNASSMMDAEDENTLYYSVYNNGANANGVGFKVLDNTVEGISVADANTGVLYATVNSVVNGTKTVDEWYNATIDAVTKIADANK